jgi:hypothetical protein
MLSKLLADLTSGKYPPWKSLDERIYQKAISRLKTLIRDSLIRIKSNNDGATSEDNNPNSTVIIIRNLMKSYSMLIDPIIYRDQ